MKNYKDFGIYDFSDYAEEITGEALFKINGGASSCGGGASGGSVTSSSGGGGTSTVSSTSGGSVPGA